MIALLVFALSSPLMGNSQPFLDESDVVATLEPIASSFSLDEPVILNLRIKNHSDILLHYSLWPTYEFRLHFSGGDRESMDRRRSMKPFPFNTTTARQIPPNGSLTFPIALNRYQYLKEARTYSIGWSLHLFLKEKYERKQTNYWFVFSGRFNFDLEQRPIDEERLSQNIKALSDGTRNRFVTVETLRWYNDTRARDALYQWCKPRGGTGIGANTFWGLGTFLARDDPDFNNQYLELAKGSAGNLAIALNYFRERYLPVPPSLIRSCLDTSKPQPRSMEYVVIKFLVEEDILGYADEVAPYVNHSDGALSQIAKRYMRIVD